MTSPTPFQSMIVMDIFFLQKPPHEYVGELLASLNYFPTTQRLTIVILKARNLKIESTSGLWGKYQSRDLAEYVTSQKRHYSFFYDQHAFCHFLRGRGDARKQSTLNVIAKIYCHSFQTICGKSELMIWWVIAWIVFFYFHRSRSQSVPHVEQNQIGQKADRYAKKDFKSSLQRSFYI